MRRKAHNSPRAELGTSADLLPDQIPHAMYRSQQTLKLGVFVVLDLGSRKDASGDNGWFVLDLESPIFEVLSCQMRGVRVRGMAPCYCRKLEEQCLL